MDRFNAAVQETLLPEMRKFKEGVSFNITQRPNTKNVVVTPQGKKLKQIKLVYTIGTKALRM